MAKGNGMPTMVVVGLGMVLIAGLAALAAWAWSQRNGPLLASVRGRGSRGPGPVDADNREDDEEEGATAKADGAEATTNGVGSPAEA